MFCLHPLNLLEMHVAMRPCMRCDVMSLRIVGLRQNTVGSVRSFVEGSFYLKLNVLFLIAITVLL